VILIYPEETIPDNDRIYRAIRYSLLFFHPAPSKTELQKGIPEKLITNE